MFGNFSGMFGGGNRPPYDDDDGCPDCGGQYNNDGFPPAFPGFGAFSFHPFSRDGGRIDIEAHFEQIAKEFEDAFRDFQIGPFSENGGTFFQIPQDRGLDFGQRTPGQFGAESRNPRDQMLKEPDSQGFSPHSSSPRIKRDRDLDSEIESGRVDVNSLLKQTPKPNDEGSSMVSRFGPFHGGGGGFKSMGKSTRTSVKMGPDGKVERQTVVTDSDGNEEITVTRSLGDQTHTVITKKKDGVITETQEDTTNVADGAIQNFEQQWHSQSQVPDSNHPRDLLIRQPDQGHQGIFRNFFDGLRQKYSPEPDQPRTEGLYNRLRDWWNSGK